MLSLRTALTTAAAATVLAAPAVASADGVLPSAQVRENAGQLAYRVHVPCGTPGPKGFGWLRFTQCDYTIRVSSGTALIGTPDEGGDAYTFARTITGHTTDGYNTIGNQAGADEVVDVRIVDDHEHERPETFTVDLTVEPQECWFYSEPQGGLPDCDQAHPQYWHSVATQYASGTVTIRDNDPDLTTWVAKNDSPWSVARHTVGR